MEEPYGVVDGNELKVYMVLYGLSKSEKQGWRGSVSALANYTHTNERTCKRILDRFRVRGLIVIEPKARKEVWIRTLRLDESSSGEGNRGVNRTNGGQSVRGNGQNAESIHINKNNKEIKERNSQTTALSSWERWERRKAEEANKVDDSISWDEYVRGKQESGQG